MMNPSTSTSMSLLERRSFEQVGQYCQVDLDHFCSTNNGNTMMMNHHHHMHPLLMPDFGSVVEDMLRPLFVELPAEAAEEQMNVAIEEEAPRGLEEQPLVPVEQQPEPAVVQESQDNEAVPFVMIHSFRSSSSSDNNGPPPCHFHAAAAPEDEMLSHMLRQFLPLMALEETPLLAQKLSDHGHVMLQRFGDNNDNDEQEDGQEARMARRLSEVTPEEIWQHHQTMFLPFAPEQAACLRQAYHGGLVSLSCGHAIQQLEHLRAQQFQAHLEQHQQAVSVYGHLVVLYALVVATAVTLVWRRKQVLGGQRRLASRIFRTVYSRPALKEAVEEELGHSIGSTPPMPPRWHKAFRRLRCARFVTASTLAVMSVLVVCDLVPVSVALNVCIGFSAFLFLRTLLWSPRLEQTSSCTCCCCGASPEDAGNLTEMQACCACCQGTGVCSAACASCCNPTEVADCCSGGCCGANCCVNGCCGGAGGCCCCSSSAPCKKDVATTMDCCSGGCCGADCCANGCCGGAGGCCCCTPSKKDVGTAMDCCASGCCGADCCANGCCGGAGGCCCCSPSTENVLATMDCCGADCCANGCCGGAGCCCCGPSQKKTIKAREGIYEGVPIQIV